MSTKTPSTVTLHALALLSFGFVSCSDDTTKSSATTQTSAPDCELYPCVQDDPETGATHKIGVAYLRIPPSLLAQPVATTKSSDLMGLSFCWPDMFRDLAKCPPVTDRITLHLQRVSSSEPDPDWKRRSRARLAEIASNHDGPFEVVGTRIQEYRLRRSDRTRYYVIELNEEEGAYVFAEYNGFNSCRVFGRGIPGIGFQYRFGSKHIESWPEMHEKILATIVSFLVEQRE